MLAPQPIAPKRKPGRPRKPPVVDPQREYGAVSFAGGANRFGRAGTMNDLVRLTSAVDDIDVTLGLDAKLGMARWPRPLACVQTLALGATARQAEIVPAPESAYRSEADKALAMELAEFHRRNLIYLRDDHRSLNQTAFLMLKCALIIGHQKAELVRSNPVTGPDAGKSVLSRIKLKSRQNSCFLVDPRGNIGQIAAYTGPLGSFSDPYRGGRMNAAGAVPYSDLGADWQALPRDKWLVVTNGGGEEESPLGESVFRAAYIWWRNARDILPLWMKALDYTAMPFMWAEMPPMEYCQPAYPLKADGTPDTAADKVDAQVHIYQAINLARQGGVAVLPHGTKVNAIHNSSSGDPFAAFLERCNDEITYAILLQLLATGTDRHMARAAGEVHQDILDLAIRNTRATVCNSITRDVLSPLTRDNFPEKYWHLSPSLSFGDVELNDFRAWSEAFATLSRDGLLFPSQIPHVHAILGLPQAAQQEMWDAVLADDNLMKQLTAPTKNPDGTTGPSQLETYTQQETGKRLTRAGSRKIVGRSGGTAPGR
jgi:hypothetical protein